MYKALCLLRDQYSHIKPVEQFLKEEVEFIYDSVWDEQIIDTIKPDIVISINEIDLQIAKCYERANKLNIPTLSLQDGIIEWRYMFQNENFNGNINGVPLFQPILADKFACIGPLSAFIITQLGNRGKVEITGMPKLDFINSLHEDYTIPKPPFKILVLTAAKPWFDDDQKEIIKECLLDLKLFFNQNVEFQVTWRVTKDLQYLLRVDTSFKSKDSLELIDQLKNCDAVITTYSTVILEAMLIGKPVAVIDYFNVPVMNPTVWRITCKSQIKEVLQSIVRPDVKQLWLQETYKKLLISSGKQTGTENVGDLILKMINFKRRSQDQMYPDKLLSIEPEIISNSLASLSQFYPSRSIYGIDDIEILRQKLVRAERELLIAKDILRKRSLGITFLETYLRIKKIVQKKFSRIE